MWLYFAYGSNMSLRRLHSRLPNAQKKGIGLLLGYRLLFHKISQIDGTGKCDIRPAKPDSRVYGVVYELSDADRIMLDKMEGAGVGYESLEVQLRFEDGQKRKTFTYRAITIDTNLKPFSWYKAHVLRGARENGLPRQYIAEIEKVEAIDDRDRNRHAREMAIYR